MAGLRFISLSFTPAIRYAPTLPLAVGDANPTRWPAKTLTEERVREDDSVLAAGRARDSGGKGLLRSLPRRSKVWAGGKMRFRTSLGEKTRGTAQARKWLAYASFH